MCAAIRGQHVVGKGLHELHIGIVILNRHLNHAVFHLLFDVEDIRAKHILANIEVLDVTFDTAIKVEGAALVRALIVDGGINPRGEVRLVAQVAHNPFVIKGNRFFKDGWIWVEGNAGASGAVGFANLLEWLGNTAALKGNPVELATTHDLGHHLRR